MGKFNNVLPAPDKCDCCGSINIEFHKLNSPGKRFNNWPYIWLCWDCNAAVGCHENTEYPLGYMANARTRLLRRMLHLRFDRLWLSGMMGRINAYRWLANTLQIKHSECHISWLSESELETAISKVEEYLESVNLEDSDDFNKRKKGRPNERRSYQKKSKRQRRRRYSGS